MIINEPTQQTKASYALPMENGVANIETVAVNAPIAEVSSAEVEKSQRQKIRAKRLAVLKKFPKEKTSLKGPLINGIVYKKIIL